MKSRTAWGASALGGDAPEKPASDEHHVVGSQREIAVDVYYIPQSNLSYLGVMAPVRHYVDFIRDGEFKGVILTMVPVGNLSRLIESGVQPARYSSLARMTE